MDWSGSVPRRRQCCGQSVRSSMTRVDPAVLCAALGSVIAGDWVILGISGGGQSLGRKTVTHDQKADEFGGAGGREFPVGGHLRSMNRDVIGVAFDAQAADCEPRG